MDFFSHGKLMITGEYAVLHGAKSLALPTRFGQSLKVIPNEQNINWQAFNHEGQLWFEAIINIDTKSIVSTTSQMMAERLIKFLCFCYEQNPKLEKNLTFVSKLDFNRNWGLGSSSTLIANLSKWANVHPFDLMRTAFNGSGYDVFVGMEGKAINYHLDVNNRPVYQTITWNPSFKDSIFFVYLDKKQDSQLEITKSQQKRFTPTQIQEINDITNAVIGADSLSQFSDIIQHHEQIIAQYLNRPTVKELLFNDYPKGIKSLGAWGGDFIMAVGQEVDYQYFKDKGYLQIFAFNDMIIT